ncbi:hypothetical protein BD413DRAFT_91065 [Trametes elegans]|nr:hypothetical protein BD413DRAFT_91065 [Trametes elegans]
MGLADVADSRYEPYEATLDDYTAIFEAQRIVAHRDCTITKVPIAGTRAPLNNFHDYGGYPHASPAPRSSARPRLRCGSLYTQDVMRVKPELGGNWKAPEWHDGKASQGCRRLGTLYTAVGCCGC